MKFHLFEQRPEAHIRKSLEYLSEAHLAWVEHQAAAEHHAALAKMYSERIARIEIEIKNADQHRLPLTPAALEDSHNDVDDAPARPESVVVYPSQATRQ